MLHHAFGEVNGKKGVWGHAIGGMGAITQAMARAAREAGAEIMCEAGVREVIVERGRAAGVNLDNGTTIRARYVASCVNPKLLYTRLVPGDALPGDFLARIKHWRNGSGTFRMNVALSSLPSFTALPGSGDHLTAGIIIGPQSRLHGPCLPRRPQPRLEPGAGDRNADPLHARQHALRARPACGEPSANTSRRNCPTAGHGTTTARRSPTS